MQGGRQIRTQIHTLGDDPGKNRMRLYGRLGFIAFRAPEPIFSGDLSDEAPTVEPSTGSKRRSVSCRKRVRQLSRKLLPLTSMHRL